MLGEMLLNVLLQIPVSVSESIVVEGHIDHKAIETIGEYVQTQLNTASSARLNLHRL